MQKSVLKSALGLGPAAVEGARIEGDSIIATARPRRAAPRCPVCGRRCDGYDTLPARRWRAPDVGSARRYVEHAPRRVECPEHGVGAEAVPWARSASSRFTSAFEDTVAWLALHMCRSALAELMRVDWHTVGGICARVEASLEEADGRGRFDGLRSIGIDETSCKKGRRHMTVVVDHDRGRVVWAARSAPAPRRRRGRPRAGEAAPADPARAVKGLRSPLLKNPEDLTEGQAAALSGLKAAGTAPWRGHLLKEGLRAVFRAGPEGAAAALDRWLARACRCRIPEFVELSRKVRRKRGGILRSIELGVSNARVEAVNNKIKVAIRQGYGFRNIDNLMALVMLRCSDLRPSLPGRGAA